MSSNKKRLKTRPKSTTKVAQKIEAQEPTNNTIKKTLWLSSLWEKVKNISVKTYSVLGVIVFFLGAIVLFRNDILKWFKSDSENQIDEKFVRGIFIPESVAHPNDSLTLRVGGVNTVYPFSWLREGVDYKPSMFQWRNTGETPMNLQLRLINNRLYVSTILRDIQKNELVCQINFERWGVVKDNKLLHEPTDQSLEIWDLGGNVILNLRYQIPNTVVIQGYYVGNGVIWVLGPQGFSVFDLAHKQDAIVAIQQIGSIIKSL